MFSHIMLGSNDIEKSKVFYDAILSALGYAEGVIDAKGRCIYTSEEGFLCITRPINGEPATVANGTTLGFKVSSPELVNAWHEAGLANGGVTCEDPPGMRTSPSRSMYLAYLRDPSGHKLCAAHFMPAS